MLQVFHHTHALGQLRLQRQQRLAAQRRTSLCRVALPGQRIGDVEFSHCQQGLRTRRPFGRQCFLPLGSADFVQAFTYRPGRPLITGAEFAKHLLQLLQRRVTRQPGADAGAALAGGGRQKGASGQGVELLQVAVLVGGNHLRKGHGVAWWFREPAFSPLKVTTARATCELTSRVQLLARLSSARGDHFGSAATGLAAPRNSRSTGSFCELR